MNKGTRAVSSLGKVVIPKNPAASEGNRVGISIDCKSEIHYPSVIRSLASRRCSGLSRPRTPGSCGPPGCCGPLGCGPGSPGRGWSGGGLSWSRSGLRVSSTSSTIARTDHICPLDGFTTDWAIVGYIDVSAVAFGSSGTIWLVASGLK